MSTNTYNYHPPITVPNNTLYIVKLYTILQEVKNMKDEHKEIDILKNFDVLLNQIEKLIMNISLKTIADIKK